MIDLKVLCEFFGWFTSVLACVCANNMQVKFMHISLYVLLASEARSFLQLIIVHFKRVGSIKKSLSCLQSCLHQKYWWTGAAMIRLGTGPTHLDLLRPSLKFRTENRSHLHWELFMQRYLKFRCDMGTVQDKNAVGTVIGVLHATEPWTLVELRAVIKKNPQQTGQLLSKKTCETRMETRPGSRGCLGPS